MIRELKRRRFTVSSLIGPVYFLVSLCGRGQYEETGATRIPRLVVLIQPLFLILCVAAGWPLRGSALAHKSVCGWTSTASRTQICPAYECPERERWYVHTFCGSQMLSNKYLTPAASRSWAEHEGAAGRQFHFLIYIYWVQIQGFVLAGPINIKKKKLYKFLYWRIRVLDLT